MAISLFLPNIAVTPASVLVVDSVVDGRSAVYSRYM
jgi:hypothetical protein